MADSFLLDVNVCLDVLLKRRPFLNDAARIFQAAEKGEIRAVVSAVSIDTIFYVLRPGIGDMQAQQEIKRMRTHIGVARVNTTVIDRALDAGWNDFEDAIQYFSAILNGCEAVVTRNTKDFPDDTTIPVLDPGIFAEKYLREFE